MNTRQSITFPSAHLDFANFVSVAKHDELVIQMNELRRLASRGVQRAGISFVGVIGEIRPSGRSYADPLDEETTMFKTISAALLAASVFAAPAFAGGYGKTTQAPIVRDKHVNSSVFNAYGWMGRDHHRHYRHHHRHHQHFQHRHHHQH